ncbi:Phosphodiest-domain-containing protein [Trametes versicolor FP-101664 SS1]|uniref:Phosphodiest-domain-containing protein n=1 Tax=Trametes versicolor (strain FP-101664) TaxID=717944 RepID=UPI0004623203|nr:Phosphodiest-domain-containing protein [Trametes versicolor FP-101664 SS1]EIW59386.1 Phosphodiest-domain-containing protein [Trametes versicolor FP-101664 SS1]
MANIDSDEEEERKALIAPDERKFDEDKPYRPTDEEDNAELEVPPRSRRRLTWIVLLFSLLLISAAIPIRRLLSSGGSTSTVATVGLLYSNGTHEFKKSALIVSIDGLRADYLDRGLTPHLLAISKDGLRAKSMKPVFPTLTFPNHWALMTGLYAESHGIVANNFWDPSTGREFHYNRIDSSWNSSWWFGEPMWETAERAGVVTANLMWPGPPETRMGTSPTYFVPWKDKVSLGTKLDQILSWIDLPLEKRPQFIMAYEPSLDQAGHLAGPKSSLVNKVLKQVDVFARDLHDAIEARNLTDIFDIVFVSDHGMTDMSHPELVYVDDILGEGFERIEHEDGWPAMGLRFQSKADEARYLAVLLEAAAASGGKFDVYTHDTMPQRWHFAHNERIAPIYVVPRMGYALTNRIENGAGMSKGNHGYDNDYASMHAMFVAHGPFSSVVKAIEAERAKSPVRRLAALSGRAEGAGWHSVVGDAYVMETFENVQIYNLMMKLLGIEEYAAPTNGTAGFWDKYF